MVISAEFDGCGHLFGRLVVLMVVWQTGGSGDLFDRLGVLVICLADWWFW